VTTKEKGRSVRQRLINLSLERAHGYLALRKAGKTEPAEAILKKWMRLLKPGTWSTQVLR